MCLTPIVKRPSYSCLEMTSKGRVVVGDGIMLGIRACSSSVLGLRFFISACKSYQLGFWNSKFRESAIHADVKLREYKDPRLVKPFPPNKMDVDLCARISDGSLKCMICMSSLPSYAELWHPVFGRLP